MNLLTRTSRSSLSRLSWGFAVSQATSKLNGLKQQTFIFSHAFVSHLNSSSDLGWCGRSLRISEGSSCGVVWPHSHTWRFTGWLRGTQLGWFVSAPCDLSFSSRLLWRHMVVSPWWSQGTNNH